MPPSVASRFVYFSGFSLCSAIVPLRCIRTRRMSCCFAVWGDIGMVAAERRELIGRGAAAWRTVGHRMRFAGYR